VCACFSAVSMTFSNPVKTVVAKPTSTSTQPVKIPTVTQQTSSTVFIVIIINICSSLARICIKPVHKPELFCPACSLFCLFKCLDCLGLAWLVPACWYFDLAWPVLLTSFRLDLCSCFSKSRLQHLTFSLWNELIYNHIKSVRSSNHLFN